MWHLFNPVSLMPSAPSHLFRSTARNRPLLALLFVICSGILWATQAQAQTERSNCGSLANHYGPFDYRTQQDKLKVVEDAHFTPQVEALIKGSSGALEADIGYVLTAFPNHPRALMAMARLGEKLKTPQPRYTRYSVACYFDRAVRFAPSDTVVRILYARFLAKQERPSEALTQLDVAVLQAKDNPFSHFNIGLAFFDLGQFDKALTQAHTAAALGFDRTELMDELKRVNQWQEAAH